MKKLFLSFMATFLLTTSFVARAEAKTLVGIDAGAVIGAFVDAGSRPYVDKDTYVWEHNQLICVYRNNGAVGGLFGGIPTYACESWNEKFGASASFAIYEQMRKLGVRSDCGMGKCHTTVNKLKCSIINDDNLELSKKMKCEVD